MSNEKFTLTDEQKKEIRRHIIGSRLEQVAVESGILTPMTWLDLVLDNFIAEDQSTKDALSQAKALSGHDDPVLITGPTGSGKEMIANILHGKRPGLFVPVNSTAIAESLFESELFGHIRGAFTGANETRKGLIKSAKDGTLFMDEIGDLSGATQTKLLRLVENKQFRSVGDSSLDKALCRFVFATHQDLTTLIKAGRFREDLFYRISVFTIDLRPLRERPLDYAKLCDEFGLTKEEAATIWDTCSLSGNIRQLRNIARYRKVIGKLPDLQTYEKITP